MKKWLAISVFCVAFSAAANAFCSRSPVSSGVTNVSRVTYAAARSPYATANVGSSATALSSSSIAARVSTSVVRTLRYRARSMESYAAGLTEGSDPLGSVA